MTATDNEKTAQSHSEKQARAQAQSIAEMVQKLTRQGAAELHCAGMDREKLTDFLLESDPNVKLYDMRTMSDDELREQTAQLIADEIAEPDGFEWDEDSAREAIQEDPQCEQAIADAKRELAACETDEDIADFLRENFSPRQIERIGAIDLMDDADTRWAAVEDCWNDNYCSDGNHDWLYEADGYKLVNCLQSDIMVLASPYFTYAQYCSPCVPGACNLDSPLETAHEDNRAYCLGHDWFDGGQAPYPVYSVATGERVNP